MSRESRLSEPICSTFTTYLVLGLLWCDETYFICKNVILTLAPTDASQFKPVSWKSFS